MESVFFLFFFFAESLSSWYQDQVNENLHRVCKCESPGVFAHEVLFQLELPRHKRHFPFSLTLYLFVFFKPSVLHHRKYPFVKIKQIVSWF